MESILKHGNRKKEKGLTLIETVIALGVISIVSVSAFSIAVFSTNQISTSRIKNFFNNETKNFADLYLAYDKETFLSSINDLTGYNFTDYENGKIYYNLSLEYIPENNSSFAYYVDLSFDGYVLNIKACNNKNVSYIERSVTK